MGHPGQFVVVRDGTCTPYRLSTLYLPAGLLAGPAAAVRNIETVGVPREVWSSCEGGAVVDLDERQLLWYGAEPPHPEWLTATGRVLAHSWPGWQVRWAYDGVHDLAEHVGLTGWDLEAAHTFRDHFAADPVQSQPPDDPIECLVTLRHPDGRVDAHAVGHPDQRSLLARGPALAGMLPEPLDPRRLPVPVPMTALHLDVAGRHVGVWGYERPRGVEASWPGWRVDFHGDRYTGLPTSRPMDLRWAFTALRAACTGEKDPAWVTERFGVYWRDSGAWQRTPREVAAALDAIDAAAGV